MRGCPLARCRRSTSGGGTRRAERGARAARRPGELRLRSRALREPRVVLEEDAAELSEELERLEGGPEEVERLVGRLALVPGHRGGGLHVEPVGVRRAQRSVTAGRGARSTASRPRRRRSARRSSAAASRRSRHRAGTTPRAAPGRPRSRSRSGRWRPPRPSGGRPGGRPPLRYRMRSASGRGALKPFTRGLTHGTPSDANALQIAAGAARPSS